MRARAFALVVVLVMLVAGACSSSSKALWPAPHDPMGLARNAGLTPEVAERLQYHVHAHLDVFVDGKRVLVPGGIGIDTANPGVHSGTVAGHAAFGGITEPCNRPCISPLHTHDATGVIHTESATRQNNTLGEFFIEWNVKLDANCVATYCKPKAVAIYVNGKAFAGDPRTIQLRNLTEVAVVIGTPPAKIPGSFDLSLI